MFLWTCRLLCWQPYWNILVGRPKSFVQTLKRKLNLIDSTGHVESNFDKTAAQFFPGIRKIVAHNPKKKLIKLQTSSKKFLRRNCSVGVVECSCDYFGKNPKKFCSKSDKILNSRFFAENLSFSTGHSECKIGNFVEKNWPKVRKKYWNITFFWKKFLRKVWLQWTRWMQRWQLYNSA